MLNPGDTLQGRYRILRTIGSGGMAMVYLAEDARLPGRQCAIKEMSPARIAPQDRNWAIQMFRQEAQMLSRLKHPGLAAVTDLFPERGNWYLVMDYVEGETLEKVLEKAPRQCLPEAQVLDIFRQLCDVLEYLHKQNPPVIFRDLKPGNVMITKGEAKLIDFGVARYFKPGRPQDTVNLGTPGYAAPEQYGGKSQSDARSDVYGLGVLLHQMLTGHDPTTTPHALPPAHSLNPGIRYEVEQAIVCATQMDAAARFQRVSDFRQAILKPPPPPLPPPPPPRNWLGWLAGLGRGVLGLVGLATALIVGGVLIYILTRATPTPAPPASSGVLPVSEPTFTPTPPHIAISEPASTPASISSPTPGAILHTPSPSPRTDTSVPPPNESYPPEGARIVFVKGSVGNTDVYVMDADGRNVQQVAGHSCDEAEPAWSPDSTRIAYQADCDGSYDIWSVSSGGGTPTQLTRTPDTDEREPDWSPDGSQIIFRVNPVSGDRNADGDLWIMNADGGSAYSLGIRGRSPVWSPDGRWVTFMSERSGSWEIYVYNLQSGSTSRLTDCSANCRWPAWSPDGRYVIYHSTTGPGSVTADIIWYVPVSGGDHVQLVSGHEAGRPSWSTQGLIVFNSDRGIEIVREDGSGRQTLISGAQHWAPAWSK